MNWFGDLPIKRKLMWVNLVTLVGALLMMASILAWFEHRTERDALVERLDTIAHVIGNRSAAAILFEDEAAARRNLQALDEVRGFVAACMFDGQRQLFSYFSRDGDIPGFCNQRILQTGHWFDAAALHILHPIAHTEENVGFIYIQTNLDRLGEHFAGTFLTFAAVFVAVFAVMFALGSLWQRIIASPLERLAEVARRVSTQHDYTVRAEKASNDEVGQFVDAFNEMLATIDAQNRALLHAREHLEETVEERTQELTVANKELEAFSYSVSHDLRAPVRSVLSFSQLVLEDCGDQLSDGGREDLERVVAGARRMERLIDELLNLSRISRHTLKVSRVDLSRMAEEVISHLREQDEQRDVQVDIAPGLTCEGDGELARVVLDNLLGNAWKYTGKVARARIEFGQQIIDDQKVFYVADNGIGFDMQHASQLFTPFTRLHRPDEYEGTGVGLATVARVIQRHGGKVWASGREGRGATFYFTMANT